MKKLLLLSVAALACAPLMSFGQSSTSFEDFFGPRISANHRQGGPKSMRGMDTLHRWNSIAIDATGLDHTPTGILPAHQFGEQVGPGRASRAMAIVHCAIFDALNEITGGYRGFTDVNVPSHGPISPDTAIAQAAHDTLSALYTSQKYMFDQWLSEDIAAEKNPVARQNGINLGKAVAAAVLAKRTGDGSEVSEPSIGTGMNDYQLNPLPGHWSWDPITRTADDQGIALGAHWGECKPFVLTSGSAFRLPAPPAMTSAAFVAAYNEVKRLGGDGVVTPTQRTNEQTIIGTYWAYDGTPSLCAPPRMYNQITVKLGDMARLNTIEFARLLALANVAMADAAIASWDSKYYWDFWRPVTAIRSNVAAINGNLQQDANWTPLGAPASNLTGANFTPPFPTYPSGHGTFGGALFEVMRRYFGTDRFPFTFMSDEFNGTTVPVNSATPRPAMSRTFNTFTQAETENARSRIYLGIHWQFDADDGIKLGRDVGKYVFEHAFRRK